MVSQWLFLKLSWNFEIGLVMLYAAVLEKMKKVKESSNGAKKGRGSLDSTLGHFERRVLFICMNRIFSIFLEHFTCTVQRLSPKARKYSGLQRRCGAVELRLPQWNSETLRWVTQLMAALYFRVHKRVSSDLRQSAGSSELSPQSFTPLQYSPSGMHRALAGHLKEPE